MMSNNDFVQLRKSLILGTATALMCTRIFNHFASANNAYSEPCSKQYNPRTESEKEMRDLKISDPLNDPYYVINDTNSQLFFAH